MKVSLFNSENMQNDMGIDAFVCPPTTVSASFALQSALRGERSNSGNKAFASLWVRRLKPREEPKNLKGETFAPDMEGLHAGDSASGSSSYHTQEASATEKWEHKALLEVEKLEEERFVKDMQISSSEQRGCGGERQQFFRHGHGWIAPLATSHTSTSSFGQQTNWKLPPITVDMNVNSRQSSETAAILHTCSPSLESRSQILHAARVQAAKGGIPARSTLGKPPLPPSHNKYGFPPRPAGHTRPVGKISCSPTSSSIPLRDIVTHPSHIAVMKESSLAATAASAGPSLLKEKAFLSMKRVMQHIPVLYSEGKSFSTPKKIATQDCEMIDAIALGIETHVQPSRTLLKESRIPKPPSEWLVGSSQEHATMQAASSASTTGNIPWEMFAGAAGHSRSAREGFVEVYNRARNELKNRKSSSSITNVLHKEMENCPQFASAHATCVQETAIVKHEGQTTDQDISKKLNKAGVVEGVAQPGGMQVALIDDHVPNNCTSVPEGEVNINPEKTSKPTFVDQTDCNSHDNNMTRSGMLVDGSPVNKKETLMVLSKRQLRMFDGCPKESLQCERPGMFNSGPKEPLQCERLPRISNAWLQRWYPPYSTHVKGLQEHKNSTRDRLAQDLVEGSAGNVHKANESNQHGSMEDLKKRLIGKGTMFQRIMSGAEPEHLEASSKAVLPSAAAMAIVRTAAKQFCMVQPPHKGSFAFWSGFGMLAPQTPEHFTKKGKRKLTFEADLPPQP